MPLEIVTFTLGPVITNTYMLADTETGESVVIDPAWDGHLILEEAQRRNWHIYQLWYSHAHFDHIAGAGELAKGLASKPVVALHPEDHALWQVGGGARLFGFHVDSGPEPTVELVHGQIIKLGGFAFEVRHTPGHTPGHVVFYCAQANMLFSGDLIFQGSVGRTDLPGGDWDTLLKSIHNQVFTLPDDTTILSGHGPESKVGEEKLYNPFVRM